MTSLGSGKPPGAARGGDGEHGNEQRSAAQCEPRAASAAGLGRGEVNERRPQADLPLGLLAGRWHGS
ncbi:hypothetical protein CKY12_23850 [Photorhabdus sp. S12-55]|nr:hypothetical protein PluDJC_18255 [Photorhabdus laumondii subsp. laumondii]RAW78061.1 hypothetical protein CKY09_23670 [Photorhabdus sp. S5P8-50]RAW78170.1 hypothetical protein CKY12_23850 [Photorhabdus sp. S12-55]